MANGKPAALMPRLRRWGATTATPREEGPPPDMNNDEAPTPRSAQGSPVTEAALAGGWDHRHRDVSGGWLRPTVFGAVDGLVTNASLIAGVWRRRCGAARDRANRPGRAGRRGVFDGHRRVRVGDQSERVGACGGGS